MKKKVKIVLKNDYFSRTRKNDFGEIRREYVFIFEFIIFRKNSPIKIGCLKAAQLNGMLIASMSKKQRTLEVILAAIKDDGRAIQFLSKKQQTPQLKIIALRNCLSVIRGMTEGKISSDFIF